MAVISAKYVADDTAYVQIKQAQTNAPVIQWREGPPARIVVAAAQPALADDTYQIVGAKAQLALQLPVLGATDLVWMLADTHVATVAENNGVRAGVKSKVSVIC